MDDYLVLCPFYQKHSAPYCSKPKPENWSIPAEFDYQPAITGKAKLNSVIENDDPLITTMRREIMEELNVDLVPTWVSYDDRFPKYRFGVAELSCITEKNPTWKHESTLKDDYSKRVMVVVLEKKNNVHVSHINNNKDCEHDIVGFVRVELTKIINDIKSKTF